MERYIAILRGINVGGKKKIRMAELKAHLSECALKNIATYNQSGNVIFDHEAAHSRDIAEQIEAIILKHYGFHVPTIVITARELSDILAKNPFVNDRQEEPRRLHVTFLSEPPQQEYIDNVAELINQPDEFVITDKAVYLFCPNGYGKTKFTNTFFEKALKVTATTRNWKTSNTLLEIAQRSPN
jgi:uncharacterized protein (DUF1697 family)